MSGSGVAGATLIAATGFTDYLTFESDTLIDGIPFTYDLTVTLVAELGWPDALCGPSVPILGGGVLQAGETFY